MKRRFIEKGAIDVALSLLIRDAAERAAGKMVAKIVKNALAEFDALLGPRDDVPPPFVPKLGERFKPDPKHGLNRPLAGWEERCRKAVEAYEPDFTKRGAQAYARFQQMQSYLRRY